MPGSGRSSTPLRFAAVVAAGAALARDAGGQYLLPAWLAMLLQAPAVLVWLHARCNWFGLGEAGGSGSLWQRFSTGERRLTAMALLAAAGLAVHLRSADAFIIGATAFVTGQLLIDAAAGLYRSVREAIERPLTLLRRLLSAWFMVIFAASALLAIPLATRSSVPDYRHNFWSHVLAACFDAVATGCLIGPGIFSFAEDYSLPGQAVMLMTAQFAGLCFATLGLCVFQRLVGRNIPLRRFLMTLIALQGIGTGVIWLGVARADGSAGPVQLWRALCIASSAIWNCNLLPQPGGLTASLHNPFVFSAVTSLAMIGSIGLPIIWSLIFPGGWRTDRDAQSPRGVFAGLPHCEAAAAFVLLAGGAMLVFLLESPRFLPEGFVPSRPLELGGSQVPLRDETDHAERWRRSVFLSVALRSAGLQCAPVAEGAISLPMYVLCLTLMFIGGGAAGVAGGVRTTAILIPLIVLLSGVRAGGQVDDGATLRRRLSWMTLLWFTLWTLINAASVAGLWLTTQASGYEILFDALAATNGVALSTGLLPHLTWLGRLMIIAVMIAGRWLPAAFWIWTARRALGDESALSGGSGDSA